MKCLALLFLAASFAFAQKVIVEFDQAADFSRYRTFAVRDGRLNSRNPTLNNEIVGRNITASIRKYLSARGLAEVINAPDLAVRYHFGSSPKTDVERYPVGWRRTRVVRTHYTEGTLVIDLHDPATRSLVWRSVAHEDKTDPDKIVAKIDTMVKKSLANYPPHTK